MSLWYRSGTVAVTAGSRNVVGTGTEWIANCRVGDGLRVSDGTVLEIAAITSDTAITLAEDYTGSTGSGLPYAVIPTRGVLKEARDAFAEALAAFGAAEDGPLLGRFAAGTVAEPGIADKDNIGTGFFFPAANQLGLVTNGIQRALLSNQALQLDVPLIGTAIQADAKDATPGRLLTSGAFGFGETGISPPNLNLDDITVSGLYNLSSSVITASTLPNINVASGSSVLAMVFNASNAAQLLVAHPDGQLAWRIKDGGTWGDWQVDAIRGSNANGEFVRYANGWQECFVSGNTEFASNTLECSFNGTFPAAFLAGTHVYKFPSIMDNRAHADITFDSVMDSASEVFSRYDTDHSNTGYFLRVRAPSGTFTPGVSRTKVQAKFAGRWK